VDGRSLAVGIREIECIGWIFYLNRTRFFVRGTNYYYNLSLPEMDRAANERDFKLMLGMNVNAIRIHCHFTNREFYDLADEHGALIWQDYLEDWYPHDREFSLRAAELYDPHISYVRNHPSVAAWWYARPDATATRTCTTAGTAAASGSTASSKRNL
jgi:beta-galactosidase/beta-glucuronidase